MTPRPPVLPSAPRAIQKGVPLNALLNEVAIECLALNILYVYPSFKVMDFCRHANDGLAPLGLMQRAQHIAATLKRFLPEEYASAIEILLASMTPEQTQADSFGLEEFFYLPHSFFIADYGQHPQFNAGHDPFDLSMQALLALTTRFTAEFAIRPFLIQQQGRTLEQVVDWMKSDNPRVRRLCVEGTRPRLPWGKRIAAFMAQPTVTLPILETLKNDESLYVRRSVANHLGDVGKDHPDTVFATCEQWLANASSEVKWVIRHALRYHAKKGNERALALRAQART